MDVSSIAVRLVRETDLAELHKHEARPDAHLARAHFDLQQAGGYFSAVALDGDGQPLGVGALDCREGTLCPELKDLWVYPEARGHGVATAIASYIEGLAAENGFVEVFLRVDPENETAIPVFIGLDYSPTGHHLPTSYDALDPDGVHTVSSTDAVYRKSLSLR